MALNKTDYGLIYNDDGSLCVTMRRVRIFGGAIEIYDGSTAPPLLISQNGFIGVSAATGYGLMVGGSHSSFPSNPPTGAIILKGGKFYGYNGSSWVVLG
jgi:hypothetical protein